MKTLYSILTLTLFLTLTSAAQVTSRSTPMEIKKIGSVNVSTLSNEYMPWVQNLEMPETGNDAEEAYLQTLKEQIKEQNKNKTFPGRKNNLRGGVPSPVLLTNFAGNAYNNDPNDNNVAVSNGGKLISMVNCTICIYDVVKDTLLRNIPFTSFNSMYGGSGFDPKVVYDPVADRFIIIFLSGSSSTSSDIVMAFSETNNPLGTWNFYSFNGNPYNNGTWSDYPAFAITRNELFLTVNMVLNGQTWQDGFKGTVIYQVNKEGGYSGATSLSALKHDSIYFNKVLVRNMCPVKGGSTEYGPNMFFLSNKNLSLQSDTIFLVDVTDTIGAKDNKVDVTLLLTPTPYKLSPNARQSDGFDLTTNDSRVLGAFYENGIIQFVQNAMDDAMGFCGVLHGIIQNANTAPSVTFNIIGDSVRDLGYPNISYAGNSSSDNSAIISFNHSAPAVYAGMSAVYFDGNSYSDILTIINGITPVNTYEGLLSVERWGDYSGSQRVYNDPGKVWVTGYYGANDYNNTWVAEIGQPIGTGVAAVKAETSHASLYPNPAAGMFSIAFTLTGNEDITFDIYDVRGVLIKELLNTNCKEGDNIFHFSAAPLASGVYILKAEGKNGPVFSKEFVKE